jgi:hypothetical protein
MKLKINYNRTRHLELLIELLECSQDMESQRKSFYKENTEEYLELSEYNIAVERHIFWQDRYQVALLMENFLNRRIDGKEFSDRIYVLCRKPINSCKKFNLELGSEKSILFCSFIMLF